MPLRPPRRLSSALAAGTLALIASLSAGPVLAAETDFPAGDEGYHTYAEMEAVLDAAVTAHPTIVRKFSIGQSYEGRTIWAAKISDNVGTDESEPEVLYDGLHHAREHMSAEMTIFMLGLLTENYGDPSALGERVTRIVNSREIWIVFMVNPDGGEYDIQGGTYQSWRKNRQPTPGSTEIGTDPNRNYDYRWGIAGSSGDPASWKYRGPAAFSTPEARNMADFIDSRVVDGRQQIRTGITFHTAGRLVMWPYGYTYTNVPADMSQVDHDALVAMGTRMASSNGYAPVQASDLYPTSGTSRDWAYGTHRIFSYTFEVTSGSSRGYPGDEQIAVETSMNQDAILYLAEQADCPYRELGPAFQQDLCGPLYDDLEIHRGWTVNPAGSDTATSGRWERGNPQGTASDGAKQLDATTSGRAALVTGRLAGASAGVNDVDGGRTSIRSAPIQLPTGADLTLRLRYTIAHSTKSSTDDFLRVRVIGPAGWSTLFDVRGAPVDRDGAWTDGTVDLSAFAGQSIRLQLEAADFGGASLFEAAVDDIRITRETP